MAEGVKSPHSRTWPLALGRAARPWLAPRLRDFVFSYFMMGESRPGVRCAHATSTRARTPAAETRLVVRGESSGLVCTLVGHRGAAEESAEAERSPIRRCGVGRGRRDNNDDICRFPPVHAHAHVRVSQRSTHGHRRAAFAVAGVMCMQRRRVTTAAVVAGVVLAVSPFRYWHIDGYIRRTSGGRPGVRLGCWGVACVVYACILVHQHGFRVLI